MNPSSSILKSLVSDSLLYVRGLLLLDDLPLPRFPALGIYFYLTKGNRIVASKLIFNTRKGYYTNQFLLNEYRLAT